MRSSALTVLVVAAAGSMLATGVSLANEDGGPRRDAATAVSAVPVQSSGSRPHGEQSLEEMVGQLAKRLDVAPDELQRATVDALREAPRRPDAGQSHRRQLDRFAADLGERIDRSGPDVRDAARAQLVVLTDWLIRCDLLTERGARLALDGFDDPDTFDPRELLAEVDLPALEGAGLPGGGATILSLSAPGVLGLFSA